MGPWLKKTCNTKTLLSINSAVEFILETFHPYRAINLIPSIFTKAKHSFLSLPINNSRIPINIKTSFHPCSIQINISYTTLITIKRWCIPILNLNRSRCKVQTRKKENRTHRSMSMVKLSHSSQVVWLHKAFIRVNSFCNRQSSFKRSNLNYRMMISNLRAYRMRRIRFLHNVSLNKISQCTQRSVRTRYQKTSATKHLE